MSVKTNLFKAFAAVQLMMAVFCCWTGNAQTALTPPMGWNDWYTYRCGISESIVEANADTIVANGMKAAGYQYVNIDDCWALSRNFYGVIVANPTQFPDGMAFLANYVHSDGLKFGLYTSHGTLTCQSKPASYNHEYLDAFTYAEWGVDFLKDDACTVPAGDNPESDYSRMSQGLLESGRPIVFSLCEAAYGYEYWSPNLANAWRTTGDTSSTYTNVMSHIDQNSLSAYVAGPGRWNDADILQIGMGDFTSLTAAQTQFSMWCVMASPLLAGNNLTTMSAQTLSVLTNAEAIAVDQDPAGEQATWAGGIQDSAEVWSKPLGYDFTTRAVVLLNRSTTASANITCVWTNLGLQAGSATVRDLWAHSNLGTFANSYTTTVPAEGAVFLKVVGTPVPAPASGTNYLSNLQPIYAYVSSNSVWKTPAINKNIAGQTMKLNGQSYASGVGVTTTSGLEYNLGGSAVRFQSDIGVDDQEGSSGSVIFQVYADGTKIYDSGIMTGGITKQSLNLDVTGVRRLTLGVSDTVDYSTGRSTVSTANYADWANALIIATNATQVPETPTGLTASPGNAITLAWNPTLAAITYNVKRATVTGGPYTTITNVPINSFTDSKVASGTYYYVVSAVSSLGEGSNSLEASAAPCNVPVAPTNVIAAGSNSQITVTWNSSTGATSYNVYRFTANTPPVQVGTGIATTNFTDTPLGASVTNFYLVTAANACNQSAWSAYAAGITTPGAPTGVVALPENSEVSLAWTAPPGSTGFNVKRSTTNGGPYLTIAGNVSESAYFDTSVTPGTAYYYVVSALNAGGEGPNSAQVSATPYVTNSLQFTQTIPSPVTVVSGQSYIYSIGVVGPAPYSYQWYNAGALISKATNATYTATAGVPGSTTYYVVVTNVFGALTSPVSSFISISPPSAPTYAYATNLLGLNPAGYWPMHEVEGAAPGDMEINYGTLGALGAAFYPDWAVTNGAFTRQVSGALANSGDNDAGLHFNYNVGNLGNGLGTWTNVIYVPHTSPMSTLNPPFTVECWLYNTNTSVGQVNQSIWGQHGWEGFNAGYAGSGTGTNISGMQLAYNSSGTIMIYGYYKGVQTPITSASPGINNWYYVAVTCDANTNFTIYVNGTVAATAPGAGLFTPDYWTPLTIGGTRGGTRTAIVSVDEFAVYTNLISDIAAHYYDALAAPSGQYFNDVRNDKPVIYLRMDAPAYSRPPLNTWPILFDYGSAGVNGLYVPGTIPGALPGPIINSTPFYGLFGDSVPQFSGVSSYADAGYAAAFNPTGSNANFTVTALFRGNPCDNRIQSIVGRGTNSWQLSVNTNGYLVFNAGNGSGAAGGTGKAPGDVMTHGIYNDGHWHQVVAVNQTNVISIYVDGVLDTSGTPAGIAATNLISGNANDVMIGSDPSYTNNPAGVGRSFAGQICDVAFINSALTAGQVQALYQSAITPTPETLTCIKAGNGQVQLNWNFGTLQSATNVLGPYQDVPDVSQPCVVPTTNAQQFYRVREN